MGKLEFQVGKKYKAVDKSNLPSSIGYPGSGVFECHSVDEDGCCWSMDVTFDGASGDRFCKMSRCHGWAAATMENLQSGEVIEVTE